MNNNVLLNKGALFCDETAQYRQPAEPERSESVTIRFRTAAENADSVYLITGRAEVKMKKVRTVMPFDFYETQLYVGSEQILYHFEVRRGKEVCIYNKL